MDTIPVTARADLTDEQWAVLEPLSRPGRVAAVDFLPMALPDPRSVRFFRIDRIRTVRSLPAQFRLRRADAFLTAGEDDARTV